MEQTRAFVGNVKTARVLVQRHTTYGLGGLTIEVAGDGRVSLRKEAFGPHETELRHAAVLEPAAVDRVFGALVDENFVELVIANEPGQPDEIYVTIVVIGAGGTHMLGKFGSTESAGFTRLVELVRAEVGAVVDAPTRKRLTL